MTDADVLKAAQLRLTPTGARIMRNAVGFAWQGELVSTRPMHGGGIQVTLSNARYLAMGLMPVSMKQTKKGKKKRGGASDGIGWTPVIVTPDMVGQTVAVFTAVECKTLSYDTLTEEQVNFLEQVAQAGGVAMVARELESGEISLDNVATRD